MTRFRDPGFFALDRRPFRALMEEHGVELAGILVALAQEPQPLAARLSEVAEALGCTVKWLRPRLDRLESVGLIRWERASNQYDGALTLLVDLERVQRPRNPKVTPEVHTEVTPEVHTEVTPQRASPTLGKRPPPRTKDQEPSSRLVPIASDERRTSIASSAQFTTSELLGDELERYDVTLPRGVLIGACRAIEDHGPTAADIRDIAEQIADELSDYPTGDPTYTVQTAVCGTLGISPSAYYDSATSPPSGPPPRWSTSRAM